MRRVSEPAKNNASIQRRRANTNCWQSTPLFDTLSRRAREQCGARDQEVELPGTFAIRVPEGNAS